MQLVVLSWCFSNTILVVNMQCVNRRQNLMESKAEDNRDISDVARNDNHDAFDFRKQFIQAVESEWAKASTNNLEKKNKQKNGYVGKKGVRNFQSVDVLN